MKKYIVTVLLLLTCVIAFAQVNKSGVTHKGEVTTTKNQGEVDLHGKIDPCPQLTPYGEIINYTATMDTLSGNLDGSVNIAVSIKVKRAENADSVGFELSTSSDFSVITAHKSFSPVDTILYKDTFKLLTAGETYYVRAFIANCPGVVYSDTVAITMTGSYTLSFFAHGGTGTMTDQYFGDGVSQRIKRNEFTRSNADFAGWTTDISGCGTWYADTAYMTLTASDSVYAQWKTWCTGMPRTGIERGNSRIDSVKDIDNNWYKVVQIGSQCWLAENMKATRYADNTSIPLGSSSSDDVAYRYYPNGAAANVAAYGYLYNWKAYMHNASPSEAVPSGVQGVCPDGWHLPSVPEWFTMLQTVAPSTDYSATELRYQATSTAISARLAGGCSWTEKTGSIQSAGNYSDTNRNNACFSAIPAAYYNGTGYPHFGEWALFVTSTGNCRNFIIAYDEAGIRFNNNTKSVAGAVRCLRDAEITDTITFDANLGTGTMSNQTAVRGVKVKLNSNQFTRTGNFEFAGWNTDRGGCGTAYADGDSITTSGNMTLYAQWSGYCSGMARTNESGAGRIDSLQDVDGNWYNVVTMPDGKCWMAENLRTTKYASGTIIPNGSATCTTNPYWYYPNNNASNKATYGLLYNWTAVMNGASSSDANPSGVQGVCPVGWHVPSHSEWTQLTSSVGSQVQYQCGDNDTQIAKALASTTGWNTSTNDCAPGNDLCSNNATLFGAMPAGYYNQQGYENFSNHANFWTSTLVSGDLVYNRVIVNTNNTIAANSKNRFNGFSVRCVRDTNTVATITFDANNGSGSTSTQTAPYLRDTVLDANTFSKTNATFAGWNTDRSGCGTSYADQATINVSGDVTLYAQWKTYCPVAARSNEMGSVAGRIDSVKDHQDNWYKVVQIGDQCWLKENMRVTTSPKGNLTAGGSNQSYYKAYYYDYSTATQFSLRERGYLYNWAGAIDTNATSKISASFTGRRGICPEGWHLPTDDEWKTMEGGYLTETDGTTPISASTLNNSDYRGKGAGKFTGGCDWTTSSSTTAPGNYSYSDRNVTGFSVLPAGNCLGSNLSDAGDNAHFWSTTSTNSERAWRWRFHYNQEGVDRYNGTKDYGRSVRCVRDTNTSVTITFDANNGSGSTSTQTAPYLRDTVLDANTFSKTNATFAGWNTDRSGCGTSYADQASVALSSNLTLYAQWKTYCTVTNLRTTEFSAADHSREFGSGTYLDTVQDYEGNKYAVVEIGTGANKQCWLKENMRSFTSPSTGNSIHLNPMLLSRSSKSAGYYDDASDSKYGVMYNWCAAVDTFNQAAGKPEIADGNTTSAWTPTLQYPRRGICPAGWHVPERSEFQMLATNSGVSMSSSGTGLGKLVAGCDWSASGSGNSSHPGNQAYTDRNITGFSMLPGGGFRQESPKFFNQGNHGTLRSATLNSSGSAYDFVCWYNRQYLTEEAHEQYYAYSVRCVRDTNTVATITFDANGGSGSTTTQTVRYLRDTVLDANTFTKTNATFAGWNTDRSGTGTAYTDAASVRPSSNLTLYAQWNTYCTGMPLANEKGTGRIDSLVDYDGNSYAVVQIGNQCWMKQSLRVHSKPDGTALTRATSVGTGNAIYFEPTGNVTTYLPSGSTSSITAQQYKEKYGGTLYNWNTATQGAAGQGICPDGWHIPTLDEFDTLRTTTGTASDYVYRLATGNDWAKNGASETPPANGPHTDASDRNSSGFSAIPQGVFTGSFASSGLTVHFWTSNIVSTTHAYDAVIDWDQVKLGKTSTGQLRNRGMAVRCLRNMPAPATISFDANGGTGTMPAMNVTTMRDTVLDANGFSKTNCTFAGWNTERSGCGTSYADQATINVSGDVTLYAQWKTYCSVAARNNEMGSVANRIDSVKDHQDNWYKVVQIGNQCWLKENMRATTEPGSSTSILQNPASGSYSSEPRAYYYGNNDANYAKYGCLYNFPAAMNINDQRTSFTYPHRGICPEGWHIPQESEWDTLAIRGGCTQRYDSGTGSGNLTGGCDWNTNSSTTAPGNYSYSLRNSSGFTALPAGQRESAFNKVGEIAIFWSSTPNGSNTAYDRYLYNNRTYVNRSSYNRGYGYSVRCVRDTNTVATITFDANNGSGSTTTQTARYLRDTVLDANTFYKTNCTFAGWNTERSGLGTTYDDRASVRPSYNLTLYAQWNTYCPVAARSNEMGNTTHVDSLIDHAGNSYAVLSLNGYCVMKSNLRVKSSPVGNRLDSVAGLSADVSRYFTDNSYGTEGYLYNWHAAMDLAEGVNGSSITSLPDNHRGLCPEGWHIPKRSEWAAIISGYDNGQMSAYNGTFQGTGWSSSSVTNAPGNTTDADKNITGFTAIPVGDYADDGRDHRGTVCYIWNTECASGNNAGRLSLDYNLSVAELATSYKTIYRSVRCVRDTITSVTITFDANNGSGTTTTQAARYLRDTVLDANTFDKTNCTFACWNTERSGCGISYADQASVRPSSNLTLYAQWNTYCTGTKRSNEEGIGHIDSVKDHQDNWYKVVQIGDQCWLKENMRCTTSPRQNQTMGSYTMNLTQGSSLNSATPFYYDDNSSAQKVAAIRDRGYLYNWAAVIDTVTSSAFTQSFTGRRGICPQGWHIPTDEEWTTMGAHAGVGALSGTGVSKLSGGCDWTSQSSGTYPGSYSDSERNSTGFSALPVGQYNGSFDYSGQRAYFWSSTDKDNDYVWYWRFAYDQQYMHRADNGYKTYGRSIRCVRNN